MFPVTSKPTPLTVFNLQALDWVHCEEETGAYLSRHTYKLVNKNSQIFKVVYFAHLKKFHKIYYFFLKR